MPAKPARNTITRQWELLKSLPPRPPGATARELTERLNHDGFVVSKRQVERDLNELSTSFALYCNDKSAPYGWYWAKDASVDLPGMTGSEALSMYLMQEVVTPLLPASVIEVMKPRFKQAKDKLESLTAQSVLPGWAEKVAHVPPMLPQLPPHVDEDILETVQIALLHGKQLKVSYFAATKNQTKAYILHPLGLVQRGVVTYLVGRVEPHQAPHLFAMQRLQSAEIRGEPAVPPENFTLAEYLNSGGMQFSDGKVIELSVLIGRSVVQGLEESPISQDQTIQASELGAEWFQLEATVSDSWQLRWWILSLGEMIQVLEPEQLKTEILSRIRQAVRQYEDEQLG